jgi:hypothetical protein
MAIAEDTAVRLGATLITNSFAYPESLFTKADDAAFDHPGIVIDAGLGDDGWRNYDLLGVDGPTANVANAPAVLPTVTAVGGTSLYLTQTGKRQSETVWNDNGVNDVYQQALGGPVGAAGGGCSDIFTAQPWQTSVPGWAQTGCGTHRLSVDVSADADMLTGFDIYNSNSCDGVCTTGWDTVGGTSMASPSSPACGRWRADRAAPPTRRPTSTPTLAAPRSTTSPPAATGTVTATAPPAAPTPTRSATAMSTAPTPPPARSASATAAATR